MPVIRLAAALVLLLASGGMLFAQTAQPAVSTPDFYADAPEADRASIAKAEEFAAQGKWLSAWKTLAEFDAANANPFILAEKVRIALDGYAQNTLHLVFGFVDLAEGQDLESARYGEIEIIGDPIEFNPGEIAKAIEDKGEAIPPVLSMMLGDFYHTVWANYQGQWLQEDAEILAQGAENYERAMAYDTYTPASLDRHSEILMTLQRFDAAESVLAKGLELDPENHVLILRMADIYFSSGRFAEVYPLADKIIAAPTDEEELNDAYVTAIKAGLFSDENIDAAVQSMAKLNSIPKVLSEDICRAVTACTDVTGFGLAGHALDLLSDGASLEIEMESLPLLPGIREMADMGLIPAGAYRNKEHSGSKVINESRMGIFAEDLIFDPQTSGGLLIAIPSELEEDLLKQLHAGGFNWSVRIGKFVEGDGLLKLV